SNNSGCNKSNYNCNYGNQYEFNNNYHMSEIYNHNNLPIYYPPVEMPIEFDDDDLDKLIRLINCNNNSSTYIPDNSTDNTIPSDNKEMVHTTVDEPVDLITSYQENAIAVEPAIREIETTNKSDYNEFKEQSDDVNVLPEFDLMKPGEDNSII